MPTIDETLLAGLIPLNGLVPGVRSQLIRNLQVDDLGDGAILFQAGESDDRAVYLLDGEVQVFRAGNMVETVRAGSETARHPLSPGQPRETTVRAHGPCRTLSIDSALLDTCLVWSQSTVSGISETEQDSEWMNQLSCSSLFSRIPTPNIRKIFELMQRVPVKAGDTIVRQGEEGDFYYVIRQGRCEVTRHLTQQGKSITLAELGPGDSFGEEALVSGSRRNASVRMLTDGILERLTKQDFVALIQAPLLRSIDRDDAVALVRTGAKWLDVRLPEEHHRSALKGSINMPLALLREQSEQLDPGTQYIVYCDSGRRSAAATFLLSQRGLDVYHLSGGILRPRGAEPVRSSTGLGTLEAEQRASRLTVDLARAQKQVAEAVQRQADVLAAREAAAREAQDLLQPRQGVAEDTLLELKERLAALRAGFDREARLSERILEKAQQKRLQLAAEQKSAERDARQVRSVSEQSEVKLREMMEQHLREGERRLEREYSRACERLDRHLEMRKRAELELETEGQRLKDILDLAVQRATEAGEGRGPATMDREQAEAAYQAFREASHRKRTEMGENEARLRGSAEAELRKHRRRLETTFARILELLDKARREREAAEKLRHRTALEARQMEDEAHSTERRLRKAALSRLTEQHRDLETESRTLRRKLEEAQRVHKTASNARDKARKRQAALATGAVSAGQEAEIMTEIARRDAEIARARQELEAAKRAHLDVEVQRHILEKTRTGREMVETTIRRRLSRELDEWLEANAREVSQDDAHTREIQNALKEQQDRIAAEQEREKHAIEDMFGEIRRQLDEE